MRVRDLMSKDVVTIGASESCQAAVERMARNRVRHLPVVDDDRHIVGVVTDRDLRHHLFAKGALTGGEVIAERLLRAAPVSDIMSSPAISVGPDDPLEGAARLMLEDKIGSLPVVEDGRPVGMITETDLLRQIVHADEGSDVEYIVVSYP